MYNQQLVDLCKLLVQGSLEDKTQLKREHCGRITTVYQQFLEVANRVNYDINSELNVPFNELVFKISNNGTGKCNNCGKETKFHSLARGYAMYCSSSCRYSDPQYKEKQRLAKISLTEEQQSEIENKRAKTNLEKYGAEYAMHSPELVAKFKSSRGSKNV